MCFVIKEKNLLFIDLFFSCVQVLLIGEYQEKGEELELKDDDENCNKQDEKLFKEKEKDEN